MRNKSLIIILIVFNCFLLGCGKAAENQKQSLTHSFEKDTEGWSGYFSANLTLPVSAENHSSLEFKNAAIPLPDQKKKALLLRADSYRNSIFMYVLKKIDSFKLEPDSVYSVALTFDLATSMPANLQEYGGTPGQTIFVKAGFPNAKPGIVTSTQHPLIGNLSNEYIENLESIGNIAKSSSSDMSFELKPFHYQSTVKTDGEGSFWIIIGVNSQFEVPLELYISNIRISID
ncbi:hypothetical protein Sgly_1876 [Syntrophobotulus glycolicus DSM 8271]|uniref:Lipoprotein n=1 Tax=Syntrophobotulus glycolicus (strain DSM 8271 / FlGlyR) TaxID=645991 RepID=F0T086_SYNGF|nr:hypothetical protein [Syntrophobotulus glycolicus]ADY56173.1 hypothetical protein Sgly_1876 [Syntrophobotulus glycolicus DSM 8271]